MHPGKTLEKIRARPSNVPFDELKALALALGFRLSRTSGSHHIFVHPDFPEIVNLQAVRRMAKPYQVRQLLRLVERYNLDRWVGR